jgi:TolB-like protein/Tfp pilus assembly protein PilF
MAHDVFISYSSLDKTAADTVCSILEQNSISCWIAPRDITPGLDFAEAIIDGIKSSKVFVLVSSSNSNNSTQVIREVDRAVNNRLPVINLRIEDVPLSKQLEYYLSSVHWLDAMTPPLEGHIDKLSEVIKILLRKDDSRGEDLEKIIQNGTIRLGQDKRSITATGKNKWNKTFVQVAIIAVILIAVILIVSPLLKQKISPWATAIEKSIAVLPFRNDSPEDSTQYFMDGVMEELLNNLQTIKSLRVCGRTSVEKYREQNKTISEIARELGVNYIIEGSGQKSGNSLRMRVQLIAAEKNKEKHIWANSFEQESINLKTYFKAQSGFAKAIASELNAALSGQERMLIEQMPTNNNEAYEAYLKGKFYLQNINQNNLDISQKHFELAIEKDPGYALAYTGIAYIWLIRQQMGFTIPEEAGPKVMEAILKAAELDSTIAEVHFMKACINYLGVWDWKTSESEFRRAIEINPNHAEAHGLYAQLLYILGRPKEAIKHSELSFKLDPLNQHVKMWYGFNFLYEKRYDETISIYREVLEMDSTNFSFYGGIGEAFHLKGNHDESLEATKLVYINFYPDIDHVFDHYKKLGYPGVMNLEGDLLVKLSEKKYIIPSDIVFLYVMAGNKEKALDWLEKGYELRDPLTPYIGRPFFTGLLLNEPRYQELLRKLNIPYYD